ncbi:hypothetical protein FDP41_003615 [Naegleria fowleri]|uniref:Uncharacterized protein n=1 Tax=Naegleria fowleri TaxID=5763 RepID=A0A6A5BIB4_NAEFO|nr:uncharacterized protein FDP41_003615 [Naegleria fowleri]KAF0977623.1 hypothetical protein FDP41_003615 [Naegleria fowleri]CAG4717298.1 unnamed protein product [Naegleria fowleri]
MFSSPLSTRSLSRGASHEPSRTGSTRKLFRKNGELFGVAHPIHATKPARDDRYFPESTYDSTFITPITAEQLHSGRRPHSASGCSTSTRRTHSVPKPLVPYKVNAPRNLLPVRFPNETVNQRYQRNASQFSLKDGSNSERTRFRTTNQVTYIDNQGFPVGFDNKGILAEKTKWFHRRQND